MNLIHKLRGKYDESYRILHGWGLSPIRNNRELKALIEFCHKELERDKETRLYPKRKEIFLVTIDLYNTDSMHLNEYINDNIDWYWN